MANAQKKYTLAIRTSQRCNQKLQESIFFSYPRKIFANASFFKKLFRHRTGFVRNRTDSASNINRLEQTVCELQTLPLRTNSTAAANKGLPQAGRQWLIEVLCFLFTFVLADRLVFPSPA